MALAHDNNLAIFFEIQPQWKGNIVSSRKVGGFVVSKRDKGDREEPDWLNPTRDRKTPYTEEEIERFVEDFILGLDDKAWSSMNSALGEENAKARIRAGFIKQDERNLTNITPKGPVH